MLSIDEASLIQDLHDDNRESFAPLYEEYFESLYRHIFYKTLDKDLTQDIVSDAFFKAFDNINQFSYTRPGSFKSWLYTIASNLLLDHWKASKSDQFAENFVPEDEHSLTKDEHDRYILGEILEELQKLDPKHRDIIIMRLWEGLSYEEIESLTGRPSTSLRKDFSIGIKHLKTISQHLGISLSLLLVQVVGQL